MNQKLRCNLAVLGKCGSNRCMHYAPHTSYEESYPDSPFHCETPTNCKGKYKTCIPVTGE